ncbi:hypothetical protein AGABI1DRAFT_113205 [Agaricus bisporus var. burnettii JB137-S8]|uniref:RRM domain-containing protein n=1 Tax=Agaricus bisporus var. burnettii (strain JB137-S8 / ATCC MYA-4627 / FGSC 10392) TaxID=597362 RepID=K5XXE1_AGABU|nr:uncharacterized protein AGABI1DRAFT_113205 [Agaricus bisporus var. burnettii JB137-S8]EKM79960.1 hypothetical protein AGABI1DRAFT_113205 [Agaricus bisporus var. burnettii JB137-S8]
MNVVREINRINQVELDSATGTASWHDDYKDSAYIFVGGLSYDLSEGDVITIFSQYGEIMDVNLPRDKETGKTKGFGFVMYEDQRSTVLAVDNLNGAKVLERTLRVDHVRNYKQPKVKNEDGEWVDAEEQSLNAKPQLIANDGQDHSDSSDSSGPDIDPEDPMRDFLIAKWKEERAEKKTKKKKSKRKPKNETPEERAARKARKKEKKLRKHKSQGVKAVEDLLSSLTHRETDERSRATPPSRSAPRSRRSRSRTPVRDRMPPPDRREASGHKRRDYSDDDRGVDDRDRHSRARRPPVD